MSTRDDAVLTDAEREAFARLQAQVAAADRSFRPSARLRLGAGGHAALQAAGRLARRAWFGPLVVLIGVAAVIAGLAWALSAAAAGLVLIAVGAVPLVERLRARLDRVIADRTTD